MLPAIQFSAKMWNTLATSVLPSLPKRKTPVRVILRQQIQPWHPSSTLVHEAAVAVLKLSPESYLSFSTALFAHQKEYFDVNVVHEARNETYARLAKLAASEEVGESGVDEKKLYELLAVSDKPGKDGALNSGNGVTDDLKLLVKANRLTGVHVTPTVLFNGVEAKDISSGFSAEQWREWLDRNAS